MLLIKIELICNYCNKHFLRDKKIHNQNIKRNMKSTYCSRECAVKASKSTTIEFNCDKCGKKSKLKKSFYDRSKSGKHYCSRACAISENNKGSKRNYKYGIGAYRKLAFSFYGVKCSVCGYDVEAVLEVHHRDNNRKNNVIENLDVLCPTHHTEYQLGIRKY